MKRFISSGRDSETQYLVFRTLSRQDPQTIDGSIKLTPDFYSKMTSGFKIEYQEVEEGKIIPRIVCSKGIYTVDIVIELMTKDNEDLEFFIEGHREESLISTFAEGRTSFQITVNAMIDIPESEKLTLKIMSKREASPMIVYSIQIRIVGLIK